MTTAHRHALAKRATERWAYPRVDESWKQSAACQGESPEIWFPKGEGMRNESAVVAELDARAKAICSRCPVKTDCLAHALMFDLCYGTWGGMTEIERAELTGRRLDG